MPNDLRTNITRLAEAFATQVLSAIRDASLEEIASISRPTVRAPQARASIARRGRRKSQRREGVAASGEGVAPNVEAVRLARARKGARRTARDFEKISAAVVALLGRHPDGLRSEDIQKALKLSKKDLPRPLKHALAAKLVRKTGTKRATRYFVR